MTSHAERTLPQSAQIETVRLVAVGAGRVARVKCPVRPSFVVAARALEHDLGRAFRVRVVARNAVAFASGRVCGGDVLVATHTACVRGGSNRVGPVATSAIAVLYGRLLCEHSLSLMA